MNWDIDDPRWTAYFLGELSPEETAEADAHYQSDPSLRHDLEALRDTLALLKQTLTATPPLALEELRREAVLRERPPRTLPLLWIPTAAAAALLVVIAVQHLQSTAPIPEALSLPIAAMEDSRLLSEPLPETAAFVLSAELSESADGGTAREAPPTEAFSAPAEMQKGFSAFSADKLPERKSRVGTAPAPQSAPAEPDGLQRMRFRSEIAQDMDNEPLAPATALALGASAPDPIPSPSPTPTNRVEQVTAPASPAPQARGQPVDAP